MNRCCAFYNNARPGLRTRFWRERFIIIRTAGSWHVAPCSQKGLLSYNFTSHSLSCQIKISYLPTTLRWIDDGGWGGGHSTDWTPLSCSVNCIVIGSEVLVWLVGFSVERNGTRRHEKRRQSDNQMGGGLHRSLASRHVRLLRLKLLWD